MPSQDHFWSQCAATYDEEFVDPYRSDVKNPLLPAIEKVQTEGAKTAADFGCGTGPILPFLAERFPKVYAVDFASGMLKKAKARCKGNKKIKFLQASLTNLQELFNQVDLAIAVNSLVLPNVIELEKSLGQIYTSLRPGGAFLAILPAMDAVHYYTMLLIDRALKAGKPLDAARKNAADLCEHDYFDFAFGDFYYKGLEQHFWQPFEIPYRFDRAGFQEINVAKVSLSWKQFAGGSDLKKLEPPWDWFVEARKP